MARWRNGRGGRGRDSRFPYLVDAKFEMMHKMYSTNIPQFPFPSSVKSIYFPRTIFSFPQYAGPYQNRTFYRSGIPDSRGLCLRFPGFRGSGIRSRRMEIGRYRNGRADPGRIRSPDSAEIRDVQKLRVDAGEFCRHHRPGLLWEYRYSKIPVHEHAQRIRHDCQRGTHRTGDVRKNRKADVRGDRRHGIRGPRRIWNDGSEVIFRTWDSS